MYTYGMFRLDGLAHEELKLRVAKRIKTMEPVPESDEFKADLAGDGRIFFIGENSERITELLPHLHAAASLGWQCILVVAQGYKDSATEAWDYLGEKEKKQVKILVVPEKD